VLGGDALFLLFKYLSLILLVVVFVLLFRLVDSIYEFSSEHLLFLIDFHGINELVEALYSFILEGNEEKVNILANLSKMVLCKVLADLSRTSLFFSLVWWR